MGYKDKTWCTFNTCARHGRNCDRALTDDVKREAKRWWGGDDFPISIYMEPPECFKPVEDE